MEFSSLQDSLVLALGAFGLILPALLLVDKLPKTGPQLGRVDPLPDFGGAGVRFLFDGPNLLEATEEARILMGRGAPGGSDLDRVLRYFEDVLPGVTARLSALAPKRDVHIETPIGETALSLHARLWNGLTVLTISDSMRDRPMVQVDAAEQDADARELALLRRMVVDAPMPIWKEDGETGVTWANSAYMNIAEDAAEDSPADRQNWPLPEVFDSGVAEDTRVSVKDAWFDRHQRQEGSTVLNMAVPVTGEVAAASQLKQFVQTLTKTFAHLSTGLAVFDKERRLVLFNPALADMTALDPVWLSSRPSLVSFLDRLRDGRMIPEPKSYASWREQVTALEDSAADGTFQQSWPLPDGQSWRVIGRPHPEGAIAFMFEDVTQEMTQTRQFRAVVDTGQAVIDSLDEAIAVFAPTGTLLVANEAYSALWGKRPQEGFDEMTVLDATRNWLLECVPSPVWGDIRDYVFDQTAERTDWDARVTRMNGETLQMRCVPLAGRATLIGFSRSDAATGMIPGSVGNLNVHPSIKEA